jgi:SulP family sulfate permease
MPNRSLRQVLENEFQHYTLNAFRHDLLAGLNVAAVALPLALAFGVASGASAAAGLVSAILAGLLIGALSGAPYQISGPTGAMSAVLIGLIQQHGLQGMWTASVMAAIFLLVIGLLRLGRFIAFIPTPVVTGFTSGIAVLIAISQLDAFLGVQTPRAAAPIFKLAGYFQDGLMPDWHAIVLGLGVMALMAFWPPRWQSRVPGSLVAVLAATLFQAVAQWPLRTIGEIPTTLLLPERLTLDTFQWQSLNALLTPALTLTALGALVDLLCGASASTLTDIRLAANQELVAQGLGNLLIPFFGGVPATGAVARTIVGIRSGGKTRVTSFIHSLTLLLVLLLGSSFLAQVPLAALAGVLLITTWRMNDWPTIRYMLEHGFKTATATFLITVLATTVFDLAQTVLIGVFLSGGLFLNQVSQMNIGVQSVDREKLRVRGIEMSGPTEHIRVAYITGPLFFAATGHFNEAFARVAEGQTLILSMRGVPLIDTSGLQALTRLHHRLTRAGGTLMLAGVNEGVRQMLARGELVELIGPHNFFWSADQAIVEAERRATQNQ